MSSQLTFSLPPRSAFGADDFIVTASNQAAVRQIESWPDWPARVLVLHGAPGSGKTHLAHIWGHGSGAPLLSAAALADNLEKLLQLQQAVIEDCDGLWGDADFESALFHLHNHLQRQGHLLLTMIQPPAQAAIALPDLRSRLRACPLLSLQPPDDGLLAALLIKQFNDRQLRVGQDVVDYLLSRIERSAAAVVQVADALDKAALAKRAPITVPLARSVLETP